MLRPFRFQNGRQRGKYMDMTAQKRFGISAAALKWLAVVTMVTDQLARAGYRWLPNDEYNVYFVLRKIGRLDFPIYWSRGFSTQGMWQSILETVFCLP